MDFKIILEQKIQALNEVAKLYEELVKKKPIYMYRLNAIEVILDTLYELKTGDCSASDWIKCYMEDSRIS